MNGMTVRSVAIYGNRITRDYVILRELDLRVGSVFEREKMEEDVRRLENLGIFRSVEMNPSRVRGGVSVEIRVDEVTPYVPYLAVEYNENDGFSLGPGFSAVNLAGRNITLSTSIVFGGATSFFLDYLDPWVAGNHISYRMLTSYREREEVVFGFDEKSLELTPQIGTFLGRHGRGRIFFSWFRMEADEDGHTLSPDNIDNLIRVGAAIGLDTRTSRQNPRHGWWGELEVLKTGDFLGGDADFVTANFDIRRFQPFAKRHTIVSGALLSLQSGEVGRDIPEYMQYYLGGANTVRGYDSEELGLGFAGKHQLIFTAEYQYLLMPPVKLKISTWSTTIGLELALFTDTGIAWTRQSELSLDRTRIGFGAGVRFLVPNLDVVRLDLGVSTSGDIRFHLGSRSILDARRYRIR